MAVNPYSSQTISGYNSSPPPDDASQVSANKIEWAKHINKIGGPLKTLAEGINSQANSAFNRLSLPTWAVATASATMAESDWHTGVIQTAVGNINYPDPAGLEDGWHHWVFNAATGNINLQATATAAFRDQTGQGASGISLIPGHGVMVMNTATQWLVVGAGPTPNDENFMVASLMFG